MNYKKKFILKSMKISIQFDEFFRLTTTSASSGALKSFRTTKPVEFGQPFLFEKLNFKFF